MRWTAVLRAAPATALVAIAVPCGCVKAPRANDVIARAPQRPFEALEPIGPTKRSAPAPVIVSPADAPAAARLVAPQSRQAGRTYVIRPKDSLWSLAGRFLGDSRRWGEIVQANPGIRPDRLMIGQRISLPRK